MRFHPLFLLSLALACLAQSTLADTTTIWKGKAAITFSGTSTLHDWSGTVAADPFTTTIVMDDAGQPRSISAEVAVKAGAMDTAEPKRDENMHTAMHVTEHPLVAAEFSSPYAALAPKDGNAPQKLPFTLTILGKEQKMEGVISNWKQTGDKAQFDVDFPVSMKASDIKVPSVLLVIRVGDTVQVHVNVTLTKTAA